MTQAIDEQGEPAEPAEGTCDSAPSAADALRARVRAAIDAYAKKVRDENTNAVRPRRRRRTRG